MDKFSEELSLLLSVAVGAAFGMYVDWPYSGPLGGLG